MKLASLPRTLAICSVIPLAAGGWFLWRFVHYHRLANEPETARVLRTMFATQSQINLLSGVARFLAVLIAILAAWSIPRRHRQNAAAEQPGTAPHE